MKLVVSSYINHKGNGLCKFDAQFEFEQRKIYWSGTWTNHLRISVPALYQLVYHAPCWPSSYLSRSWLYAGCQYLELYYSNEMFPLIAIIKQVGRIQKSFRIMNHDGSLSCCVCMFSLVQLKYWSLPVTLHGTTKGVASLLGTFSLLLPTMRNYTNSYVMWPLLAVGYFQRYTPSCSPRREDQSKADYENI